MDRNPFEIPTEGIFGSFAVHSSEWMSGLDETRQTRNRMLHHRKNALAVIQEDGQEKDQT